MESFVRITRIGEVKTSAQTGGEYRQIWGVPVAFVNSQEVFSNQSEKSRIVFGANKDNTSPDPIFTSIQEGRLKAGGLIMGQTVQFNTTEYQPEGYNKPVTKYTCIVFNEEDAIKVANRQLKNNYACVIDPATQALTAPEQLEKPTTAPMQKQRQVTNEVK